MDEGKHRNGVSGTVLTVAGVLAAALLICAESAAASVRSDASESTTAAALGHWPGDIASASGNPSAQELRERVPAALFPIVTETLQSGGSSRVYNAMAGVAGEGTYRLANPVHSVSAEFGPNGVSFSSGEAAEWKWSLRFAGYGRGRTVGRAVDAKLVADGNRVTYAHGGVTEWYVNGPLGLQQGFTFEGRPLPWVDGPLVVRMALSGDVTVEVNEDASSALLRSRESRNSLRYGGLYAYDAAGMELSTRLQATAGVLSILVDDSDAQYPITIDPFIEKSSLAGAADDRREYFGLSASVSGDTVVIGAAGHSWENVSGAVYVFTVPDSGLIGRGTVVLESPRSTRGDSFGESVSISGDTIVVGSPGERIDEEWGWRPLGAAYVFTKPSGGWVTTSEASRLSPPEPESVWRFGQSVAIDGDTVVVGAESGPAYVFDKPNDGWADMSNAAELTASDGSEDDKFGHSVGVSGDTVVIGAYLADLDDDEEDFGAAYIFSKPSGGWATTSESVKLTAPDGAPGREFGRSLSVSGDTLVIGAPYSGRYIAHETYDEAATAEDKTPYLGSVYVFTRPDTGWAATSSAAKLTASDGMPWARFGWSVSVSADGDTIVVGDPDRRLPGEHGGYAHGTGAAYVFTRPSEGWAFASQERDLSNPAIMPYDSYGSSVSIGGDIIVVGSSENDNENGSNAGSAYVFRMPTDGWGSDVPYSDPATLTAFDGPAGDRFGHSVAVDGDVLVVGVPGDHDSVRGTAYVFARQGTEWEYESYQLAAPDATPGGRLGTSVAVSQDTIVVGAPGAAGSDTPGAAYVFIKPAQGWEYTNSYDLKLSVPDGAADGRFGYSVAVSEDTIVVGAPGAGAAYVYAKPDPGWTEAPPPAKLAPSSVAQGSRFGHAVSITGTTIVVGAPGAGSGNEAGAAYVYTKPDSGWMSLAAAAKLTASDDQAGQRFGYAVSASESTVVVGAPGRKSGDGEGAAYVFTKPDAGWTGTSAAAKLTASDGAAADWFGNSVSVSGDFIAIGARGADAVLPGEDLPATRSGDSGAVYAFRRPEGGWTSSSDAQKLTANEAAPGDAFGYAVSVSGDSLAVGIPDDVVSQPYYLRGAHSGSVRVFTWPGFFWEDTPAAFKVRPPSADHSRIFGIALSADGNTAVVGTIRADGEEQLSLRSAEAFVYERPDGDWQTSSPATLTLPEGTALSYVSSGLAVSEDGDTIVIGFSAGDFGTTTPPSAALVFTRPEDGWVSTTTAAKLTMPDGESEGNFGRAVSISGATIVVGAHGDDSPYNAKYGGSAYVFTRPEGGWASTTTAAKLAAPAGDPGDQFGSAVSVMGDTIVVGAPGDRDIEWSRAGSAYVFTRPEGEWVSTTTSAKLASPDGWSEYSWDQFGSSVSVRDDKIVVGAPGHAGRGAAYVFTRPTGGWTEPYVVAKLSAPGNGWDRRFGASVSISDDAIFVGAAGGGYDAIPGEAFVFPIPEGKGVFTGSAASLSDPRGGALDEFGGVVSAGESTVAVGAPDSDDHGVDRGAVYIFSEPTGGWDYSSGPKGHTATLSSPDGTQGDLFGRSISASADAIAVGGPTSGRVSDPGAAYVFSGPFESLFSRDDAAKLSPPDGDAESSFGWSVSLTADAMAVGSPGLEDGTGAAYVFTKPAAGWASSSDAARLTSPRGETDRNFGYSVSLNAGTVAVGATRRYGAGSVFLFTKPEDGIWISTSTAIELQAPSTGDSSSFGWSVAITDDTLAVGMPSEQGTGAVYVYTKPPGGWASVADPVELTSPDGTFGDMFGASVAVSADTVVVGAAGFGNRDLSGAAYVFTRPTTGWISTSEAAKLTPEVSEPRDWFGWSVAARGDAVVVGGQNYGRYQLTNTAYVFNRPMRGWVSTSATPISVPYFSYGGSHDRIGVSAGVAGDTVVVGAPSDTGLGLVSVFEDFLDD